MQDLNLLLLLEGGGASTLVSAPPAEGLEYISPFYIIDYVRQSAGTRYFLLLAPGDSRISQMPGSLCSRKPQ